MATFQSPCLRAQAQRVASLPFVLLLIVLLANAVCVAHARQQDDLLNFDTLPSNGPRRLLERAQEEDDDDFFDLDAFVEGRGEPALGFDMLQVVGLTEPVVHHLWGRQGAVTTTSSAAGTSSLTLLLATRLRLTSALRSNNRRVANK